jgi:hypothetical protein
MVEYCGVNLTVLTRSIRSQKGCPILTLKHQRAPCKWDATVSNVRVRAFTRTWLYLHARGPQGDLAVCKCNDPQLRVRVSSYPHVAPGLTAGGKGTVAGTGPHPRPPIAEIRDLAPTPVTPPGSGPGRPGPLRGKLPLRRPKAASPVGGHAGCREGRSTRAMDLGLVLAGARDHNLQCGAFLI